MNVDIFTYTDYQTFLRVHYDHQRASNKAFSIRNWCRRIQMSSPGTLHQILSGKRHPGKEVTEKLCSYFKFNQKQRWYFEELIHLAKTSRHDQVYLDVLRQVKRLGSASPEITLDMRVVETMAKWYSLAICEMVDLEGFQSDPKWISQKLVSRISPSVVAKTIENLEKIGLLKRDAKTGRLAKAVDSYTSPIDIPNEAMRLFHESMIELAKQSIRSVPVEKRDISGSTVVINTKDLPRIKELTRKFRKELFEIIRSSKGDAVYQLNVQLFPLTKL